MMRVFSEPSPLVVEGRWEGLLHTRTTAALSGHIPTGNARVTRGPFNRWRECELLRSRPWL